MIKLNNIENIYKKGINMDKELLLNYLEIYKERHDSIMEQYGTTDGFIVEGKYWWDYYKELIKNTLDKTLLIFSRVLI